MKTRRKRENLLAFIAAITILQSIPLGHALPVPVTAYPEIQLIDTFPALAHNSSNVESFSRHHILSQALLEPYLLTLPEIFISLLSRLRQLSFFHGVFSCIVIFWCVAGLSAALFVGIGRYTSHRCSQDRNWPPPASSTTTTTTIITTTRKAARRRQQRRGSLSIGNITISSSRLNRNTAGQHQRQPSQTTIELNRASNEFTEQNIEETTSKNTTNDTARCSPPPSSPSPSRPPAKKPLLKSATTAKPNSLGKSVRWADLLEAELLLGGAEEGDLGLATSGRVIIVIGKGHSQVDGGD